MSHSLSYALWMLVAGLGIPLMAALNAGLGSRLQNPVLATVILFAVGLAVAVSVLLLMESTQGMALSGGLAVPSYFYLGGLLVAFYVLSVTWVVPRFGVANAVAFVLLGQMIAMSLIDHFGFAGALRYSLTWQRLLGLGLMALGVMLVLSRRIEG